MIRRVVALVVAGFAAASVLAACGGGSSASAPAVALDGSPRVADDAGRLTEVADDFSTITLDGERRYVVDPELISFSAVDGSIQPLLRWRGQYVQVGLDDDTVTWVGGLAAVVDVPDEDPVVYFTDVLVEVDEGRLVFRSGTVLDAAGGVEPPSVPPVAVVATVDVASDRVVALEPG